MGHKLMRIHKDALVEFFRINGTVMMEGLPADAKVTNVDGTGGHDPDMVELEIWSKEWDDMPFDNLEDVEVNVCRCDSTLSFRHGFIDHYRNVGLAVSQIEARWKELMPHESPLGMLTNPWKDGVSSRKSAQFIKIDDNAIPLLSDGDREMMQKVMAAYGVPKNLLGEPSPCTPGKVSEPLERDAELVKEEEWKASKIALQGMHDVPKLATKRIAEELVAAYIPDAAPKKSTAGLPKKNYWEE